MINHWPHHPHLNSPVPKCSQPHLEALDWIIKDDSTGRYIANRPDKDEEVVRFIQEDLH